LYLLLRDISDLKNIAQTLALYGFKLCLTGQQKSPYSLDI